MSSTKNQNDMLNSLLNSESGKKLFSEAADESLAERRMLFAQMAENKQEHELLMGSSILSDAITEYQVAKDAFNNAENNLATAQSNQRADSNKLEEKYKSLKSQLLDLCPDHFVRSMNKIIGARFEFFLDGDLSRIKWEIDQDTRLLHEQALSFEEMEIKIGNLNLRLNALKEESIKRGPAPLA